MRRQQTAERVEHLAGHCVAIQLLDWAAAELQQQQQQQQGMFVWGEIQYVSTAPPRLPNQLHILLRLLLHCLQVACNCREALTVSKQAPMFPVL